MGTEVLFFVLLIAAAVDLLIAYEFYQVAKKKGHNDIKYFWLSFFFGIFGHLLVIALPDRGMMYFPGNSGVQSVGGNPQGQNALGAGSGYNDLPEL